MRRMRNLFAATLAVTSLTFAPFAIAPATAADCPDAEVVFARGRSEAPGIGWIGDAFVNALRSKTSKSVGVYAVN